MASDSNLNKGPRTGRQFIGMMFKCCNVYARLYLRPDAKAFTGRCPKCGKPAKIEVSKDGSKSRFFES
jgi:PHP family Zn ribbon phosphoesterase